EVAGWWHGPLPGRVRGRTGAVRAARAVLEEDWRVDPAQAGQSEGQEVAGEEAPGCAVRNSHPAGPLRPERRPETPPHRT
ncbi:hypothetical protein ABZ669_37860, partial [Streptomyces hirsutus]|uniref:hypothetical protein n=1 Tax=Streptomyces hirsutus TaxID=35620 RepID=UPI0034119550